MGDGKSVSQIVIKMIKTRLTEANFNEILMYLGHKGQDIKDVEPQIRACLASVTQACRPQLVYRYIDVDKGNLFKDSEQIEELLAGCRRAVIFAATLGSDVDRLISRTGLVNMADAAIQDACASALIENVCNNFESDLRIEVEAEGKFLTSRFSPGYGDWPVEKQRDIFRILNAEHRIGIGLNSSDMMSPAKSVTAVMGISREPAALRMSGCENCNLFMTCAFRRSGTKCEK